MPISPRTPTFSAACKAAEGCFFWIYLGFILFFIASATFCCPAQTSTPSTQQSAATHPTQPHHGTVIFSRSTDETGQTTTQTGPVVALPESAPPQSVAEGELAPPRMAFTAFDLDVHLLPSVQQIAVRTLVTIRNDGKTPLTRIPLQISSSLNWEAIRIDKHNIAFQVATINSDADHTGQLHEAIFPLDAPLPPGQALQLDVTYSGHIALSAQRLQSIGTPDALAQHSDWDQISLPFTGLRGFGNVVWYPVVSAPVMLGDGARLFDEIGFHKLRLSGARFRLRLTVEFPHGHAPTVALINGHSVPLAITEPSSTLDQSQEVASVATADSGNTSLGFEAPSLFVAARTPHPGPNLTAWTLPEDNVAVEFWTTAANAVTPFLKGWLGLQPRSQLTLLDLPDLEDAPFETGALLAAPLREPHSNPNALNGVLVHALTHAWLLAPNSPQPPPAWLNEGVAQFLSTLWEEKQNGRDAALRMLDADRAALALAEPASPGQNPGQPLAAATSPVYYRTKAAYVLWMLRDLAGDPAISAAFRAYYPATNNLANTRDAQADDKLNSGSRLYQGTDSQAAEKPTALKGHDFSRADTDSQAAEKQSLVSGHDFSRADNDANKTRAGRDGFQPIHLSPEGSSSGNSSTISATSETNRTPTHFEKLLEASEYHPDLAWFFADWVDADKGLPDLTIDGVFPTSASAGNWLVAVYVSNAGYAAADVPVTVRSGTGSDARSVTQRLRVPARGKAIQRILIQGKPTEVQVNDGTVPETQASVHVTKLEESALAPPGSSQSNPPKR